MKAGEYMKGRVHSIETMGTVDGPGMRFVVFLQGCPMRCAYCHNPDTWDNVGDSTMMTIDEIWEQFERNRSFYTNGGITVTGGEPLVQIDFVLALFTYFKERGIHTCLDTSGITYTPVQRSKFEALLAVTDLAMLDIKDIDPTHHKDITKQSIDPVKAFAKLTTATNTDVWIRHVIVPGLTDNKDRHYRLGFFLGAMPNIKALDCLPYHVMGVNKYKELNIPYRLEGTQAAPKELAVAASKTVLAGMKAYRQHQWSVWPQEG